MQQHFFICFLLITVRSFVFVSSFVLTFPFHNYTPSICLDVAYRHLERKIRCNSLVSMRQQPPRVPSVMQCESGRCPPCLLTRVAIFKDNGTSCLSKNQAHLVTITVLQQDMGDEVIG